MGFWRVSEQPCWFLQTTKTFMCLGVKGQEPYLHLKKTCHIMFTLHDYDLKIIAGVTCEMGCQAFKVPGGVLATKCR